MASYITRDQFDTDEEYFLAQVRNDLTAATQHTRRMSVAGGCVRNALRRVEKRWREISEWEGRA